MFYLLLKYIPKEGLILGGVWHPAVVGACCGIPLGIGEERLNSLVPDPFERALILSTGVIVECYSSSEIQRAWRVKKGRMYASVVRGHRLKVKD